MVRNAYVGIGSNNICGYATIDDTWAELMSHHTVEVDETGQPAVFVNDLNAIQPFVYVDEQTCIGCTLCAQDYPNTFMIEADGGKARAMRQGFDNEDDLMTACTLCPVNCIDFVSWDDLVALEMERMNFVTDKNAYWVKLEGMLYQNADTLAKANKSQRNRMEALKSSWDTYIANDDKEKKVDSTTQEIGIQRAEQRAIDRLTTGINTSALYDVTAKCKCNNCPMNMCDDCPMYGINKKTRNQLLGPVIEATSDVEDDSRSLISA